MKIRRTQAVLIAFAVASWFGAIFELGAASRGGDDCLENASDCRGACLEETALPAADSPGAIRCSASRASPSSYSAAR